MDQIKRIKILRPGRLKTRERDRTVLESTEIKIIAQLAVFQKKIFSGRGWNVFYWSSLEQVGAHRKPPSGIEGSLD